MAPKLRTTLLILPGSNLVPIPIDIDSWLRHPNNQDIFWKIAEKDSVKARPPFEFVDHESTSVGTPLAHHVYKTLFIDNKEVSMMNPRSIFKMRLEIAEVPWGDNRFESKSQWHLAFDKWFV